MTKLIVDKESITLLEVDAIVNAANNTLLGGGGVDGAIHKAAGKKLKQACRPLNGFKTGEVKITPGFKLPAKYVIHAVGPVWRGGSYLEEKYLASCYRRSLEVAIENNIRTIAFPNISTGVYGFPKEKAAQIAIHTVKKFIESHADAFDEIHFVCFDSTNLAIYSELLPQEDNQE